MEVVGWGGGKRWASPCQGEVSERRKQCVRQESRQWQRGGSPLTLSTSPRGHCCPPSLLVRHLWQALTARVALKPGSFYQLFNEPKEMVSASESIAHAV